MSTVRREIREENGRPHVIEIRREGKCWSVFADGLRLVDRESHIVASNIVDGIVRPGVHWPSESDEVSASILAWLRAQP